MEISNFLSKLVGFDTTINPNTETYPNSDCADYIKNYAKKYNYKFLDLNHCYSTFHPDREIFPVVVYKEGTAPGKTVLYLGHIDVVPVTEEERTHWDTNPFHAVTKSGNLYGRGSADMKGGVATFFAAFNDAEILSGRVIIALCGDEEVGGMSSMPTIIEALKAKDMMPDFVINAEPSNNNIIVTKRRGATWLNFQFERNIRKARGTLKRREFFSQLSDGSKSLHSSYFVLGADTHAMFSSAKFSVDQLLCNVVSSSDKENSVPLKVTIEYIDTEEGAEEHEYDLSISKVMAGLASLASSITYPVIPSKYGVALCPNLFSVGQNIILGFDIRSMLESPQSHKILANQIQTHFSNVGINCCKVNINVIDPMDVDPDSYLPQLLKDVAENHGMKIIDVGEKLGGASDTRYFTSLGIPGIELGPVGKNAHGINEHVELDTIEKLKHIYQETFFTIQKSDT